MFKNGKYIKVTILSALLYISFNFVHPITPDLIEKKELGKWIFGYLFAAMSLGSLLFAPFWGSMADKYGRKKLILFVGLPGYAIAQLGFGLSSSIVPIIFFRFLAGATATSTVYPLISTYLSDITPKAFKTRVQITNVALIGLMTPIGYKVGAYIGDNVGLYATIYAQIIAMGALLLLGMVLLGETHYETTNQTTKNNVFKSLVNSVKINRGTGLLTFLFIMTPFYIVRVTNGKFLDVLQNDLGYSATQIANTALIIGVTTTIFMIFIAPFLTKLVKDEVLMKVSSFVVAIPLLVGALSQDLKFFIIMVIFYNIGKDLLYSLHVGIITKKFNKNQATVIGLQKSFTDLGSVLGPIFIGMIFAVNNWLAFTILGGLALITGTILLFWNVAKTSSKRRV